MATLVTLATATTIDIDDLNNNLQSLNTELGNLTEANFSASMAIPNADLANSYYEFSLPLNITGTLSATSVAFAPLPDVATDGPYTIEHVAYYIINSGSIANSTTLSIASGYVTGGAFSVTTTHVNAQSIAHDTTAPKNGSLTVANATIPASANNAVLRLAITAVPTTASENIFIGVKLKHGLRS